MPDSCYFDFVNEPITSFRKLIFKKLISRVDGDKILDLGCGQVGDYWALGYCKRVKQIDFFDYHLANIEVLNQKISTLSPENLEKNYANTINFLYENNLIETKSFQEIAADLISKIFNVSVFDFLSDSTDLKYDTIIAIESLECVNSEDDFILGINNISKILKPGGKLLVLVLRYNLSDKYVQKLISEKMEGSLNPNQELIEKLFKKSNLNIKWIETILVPELHNYPEAIFLEATNI